jgi:hypothetical protein
MIVVLDTNIWISALFFGGKPEQALTKAFEKAIRSMSHLRCGAHHTWNPVLEGILKGIAVG